MTTQLERPYIPEWSDGDKLRKIRRLLRLSQKEFASMLEVNPVTYSAWETDRVAVRDIRSVAKKIKALTGIPLWWWFDEPPPFPPTEEPEPPLLLPRLDSNQQPSDSISSKHVPATKETPRERAA